LNYLLIILGAGLTAAVVTFGVNWLSLSSWRRNRDKHWSEQAQLLFPAMSAARSNLWVIPPIFVLTVLLFGPKHSTLWYFTGLTAAIGAYGGTLPMDYEIFPRLFVPGSLRLILLHMALRFLLWSGFIGAAVWMPETCNWVTLLITVIVLGLWAGMQQGGALWFARRIGQLLPAPERLQKIADETSARMHVPFRELLVIRSQMAQAVAYMPTRRIGFTERLLEIAPEDEIAAICAHELAHLTESKAVRYSRYVQSLTFIPWLYFNPVIHTFGFLGFMALLLNMAVTPRLFLIVSRKMESRADQLATGQQSDSATYARALQRLYTDCLVPAVFKTKHKTHPDLYDRLLAAGVTPDFPRPAPAETTAPHGRLFAILLGLMFALFVLSLLGTMH
jgi:Zn-dependent protease with chaperone function